MPTIFTHPVVPLMMKLGSDKQLISRRLLWFGLVVSILPDIDVLAFKFGIPYSDPMGHRGMTHSISFALFVSLCATAMHKKLQAAAGRVFIFSFTAIGSHGLLDAMTNGGLGIALFWPFTNNRYFLPFQVVEVSPMSPSTFIQGEAWHVLVSEIVWIWLPLFLATLVFMLWRKKYAKTG